MRIKTQEKVRAYLAYGLGSVFVLALVMPLIWVVTTSVRPLSEMTQTPPLVFPRSVTFSAYVDMWDTGPFGKYFANSMVISLSTALIALAFSICAAYAFARFRFRGNTLLLMVVVMSQMLPGSSILIPLFQVIRSFGLLDTHVGMVLIYTGFAIPFCTWLLNPRLFPRHPHRPRAGRTHRRLQSPRSYSTESSCHWPHRRSWRWGPFAFLLSWNEFLFAFVFTKSQALTIPVGLAGRVFGPIRQQIRPAIRRVADF